MQIKSSVLSRILVLPRKHVGARPLALPAVNRSGWLEDMGCGNSRVDSDYVLGVLEPGEAAAWRVLEEAASEADASKPRDAKPLPTTSQLQLEAIAVIDETLPWMAAYRERFMHGASYFA